MVKKILISKYESNPNPYGAHVKIVKFVGKNKRVLEVGCSAGYISEKLRENGCVVTGIEINIKAAEVAKKYCKEVFVGDVETLDLPFELKSFDVILMSDVLEHLRDPKEVLKKLYKYLSDDGRLILSVPNIANWKIRLKLLFGKFDYMEDGILDRTHLRFFTLKTIKETLKGAGFWILTLDITPSAPLPFFERNTHLYNLKYHFCRVWKSLFSFQFLIIARR